MKLGRGSKSRSRCAVLDSNVAMATLEGKNGGTEPSCWESMPRELLREVFMKLEASESSWPSMRNVVVCAGVCRSWREAVKAVVMTPEISGKLTFPISLKQPGRRDSLIQCFIRRNRETQTYHLYLNSTPVLADDGKFLLAARRFRRPTCSDFIISLHADDFSKGGSAYIGKLRSNFVATKFIVNDAVPPHPGLKMLKGQPSLRLFGSKHVSSRILAGNYPVAHVSYELNMLGNRGPRKMHCVMDAIPASAAEPGGVVPTQTEFPLRRIDSFPPLLFFRSKANRVPPFNQCHRPLVMRNKSPRWHEQLQCWCLNFHGRVTVASVKNFQLVAAPPCDGRSDPENEKVILQFGKVGKDVFTMDYGYPLSAFQAFAICLSSFDTKIACDS